jgi:hypothetical protein
MDRVVIIPPEGEIQVIPVRSSATLEEVQKWVGGGKAVVVQMLPGNTEYEGEPAQLLVDEDGFRKAELLPNRRATLIVDQQKTPVLMSRRGIVGNMVVLQGAALWT